MSRRELVAAMRELNAVVATTAVADDELDRAAEQVRELSRLLGKERSDRPPRTPFAEAVGQSPYEWQTDNPAVPGLVLRFEDGAAVCELPDGLGPEYEGPPDLVHGGVLASVLDVVLSSTAQHHDIPCVTASLTLDYRAPTPLAEPLVVTARLADVGPRKVLVTGEVRCAGTATVEARGLFVRVDRSWVTPRD